MSVLWLLFCGREVMTVMGALKKKKEKETKNSWLRKLNTALKWPDCDIVA